MTVITIITQNTRAYESFYSFIDKTKGGLWSDHKAFFNTYTYRVRMGWCHLDKYLAYLNKYIFDSATKQ